MSAIGIHRLTAMAPLSLIVVAIASCGTGRSSSPADRPVATNPSQLVSAPRFEAAAGDPRTVVINVHVPYAGEIAGTDRFLPYTQIAAHRTSLPPRSSRLAVYCRTGRMSAIASRTLARLGYRHVVELSGGMQAWTRSGRKLRQRASR